MKTVRQFGLAGLMAALAACGSSEEEPPPPVEETVFGDSVGAMERARAVEDVTMQRKDDIDAALRESENADAP